MATWDEQWSRVLRWHERFRLIGKGVVVANPIECYDDDVLAFFVSCYHLKDWLKNDPASGVSENEVETFVAKSLNLRICGDLANGSKHLTVTRPRLDATTKVTRHVTTYGPLVMTGQTTTAEIENTISAYYGIRARGVLHDAFEVATRCVEEWDGFLHSKDLL
jgi:hypothetical protein